jgi:dCMP deaminase
MARARAASENSTDRSTQVGCVIVAPNGEILVEGCNAFPHGADLGREERHERPAKYKWTEHAERNAIYAAAAEGIRLSGSTMYLPWFPCVECARAIVQARIARLVAHTPDLNDPRWGEDFIIAQQILREGGVAVEEFAP